jgi:hypothetical protein
MPSKKQQRRREKSRRHEFEEVYLDDDGNEITAEEYEALTGETTSAVAGTTNGKRGSTPQPTRTRAGRAVPAPSWKRVAKRGLLFAPLMYLTMYFLDSKKGGNPAEYALMTGYLLALFIPFSYVLDRMMYRRFARQRETAKR